MGLKSIQIDFENTPESFLERIDYRETGEGEWQGDFLPGELVFADLREDMAGARRLLC